MRQNITQVGCLEAWRIEQDRAMLRYKLRAKEEKARWYLRWLESDYGMEQLDDRQSPVAH